MKEGTHLTLKDGREILLQDDKDIFLSVRSGHETLSSYPFTCPSGGYGGGTLLLSPSEQYLIFSFFSGQSEEGFSLFHIEDSRLVPLFESEYFYGEGEATCSPMTRGSFFSRCWAASAPGTSRTPIKMRRARLISGMEKSISWM